VSIFFAYGKRSHDYYVPHTKGYTVALGRLYRPLTADAGFNSCGICGGQGGTEAGFPPSASVFPCQYHSTNVLYSFIHLLPMPNSLRK
jgi:hypothetical protein